MEFGYPKEIHLCSKKDISRLLSKGTVFFRYPFKMYCYPVEDKLFSSYVISVPKKNFKRAVHRNRIKRLVRESIRLNQSILCNFNADFLFIYVGKEIDGFTTISQRIRELLEESCDMVEKVRQTSAGVAFPDADKTV